jgi:urease accessory protein
LIARTVATVDPGHRLTFLRSEPPLTLRQVQADDDETCALCLVGTAAGPLAGDQLSLELEVRAGAKVVLTATGASIAQGRPGGRAAELSVRAALNDGSQLTADTGARIVCTGSRVDVQVVIEVGTGCSLEWRELIVLGRSDEPAGEAVLRWDVTQGGVPVLRQVVDLSDELTGTWPGLLAGNRVLASVLLTTPTLQARTIVAGRTAAAQRIDDRTALITVLAPDTASATRQVDDLLRALRHG